MSSATHYRLHSTLKPLEQEDHSALSLMSAFGAQGGGGGTCQNLDKDARPIFLGFEIWPNPIFLGWQIF